METVEPKIFYQFMKIPQQPLAEGLLKNENILFFSSGVFCFVCLFFIHPSRPTETVIVLDTILTYMKQENFLSHFTLTTIQPLHCYRCEHKWQLKIKETPLTLQYWPVGTSN